MTEPQRPEHLKPFRPSTIDEMQAVIADMWERLITLEKAVAEHNQMAMMLTPKATLPIVASADSNPVLNRLIGLQHERHSQFIPDYDSEGTY